MSKHRLLSVALLLMPLAALHAGGTAPGVPRFGKLCVGFFQALAAKGCPSRKARLGKSSALVFNAWN